MQDPLDPLPLDSGSLPPVQDPGAQLAPFMTLQLPLEPPSKQQSTGRHSTWLLYSLCPKHFYTGAVPPKVLPLAMAVGFMRTHCHEVPET